jgi:hypothetical protein
MFDVLWTDPDRELVGERIIRKELEAESKGKYVDGTDTTRTSRSSGSSASSERRFGFFTPRSKKQATSPRGSTSRLNLPTTPTNCSASDRRSSLLSTTDSIPLAENTGGINSTGEDASSLPRSTTASAVWSSPCSRGLK